MQDGISVIIMTLNEEQTLARALNSLSGIADQIVIVDTGSTDATLSIARSHVLQPEVYEKIWSDDFSAIRNHALSLCKYQYCFVLDADEYIDDACRSAVRNIIKKSMLKDPHALYAPVIDNLNGHILRNNPRIFFRRETLEYRGRVHEYLHDEDSTQLVTLDGIIIIHTGYQFEAYEGKQKNARNSRLLRLQIAEEPENFRWKYFILRYLDHASSEALAVLNDFGDLPLPYSSNIEVYAFNAKSRLIMCLLEKGEYCTALAHASQLYTYYKDYDTTLLFTEATYQASYQQFRQDIQTIEALLDKSESLTEDEYLHEKFPLERTVNIRANVSTLRAAMNNIDEK
ncbi:MULTISPECIES: glycosyltransferase family 2 protein [unclassified Serratia (in: enterobacteria)]|uniref:glycosyltransferase family 2 protein n=1 Tax=unclassified Serratia (in: enterobacteria) TaxID=2647522 RepID=UPI0030761D13